MTWLLVVSGALGGGIVATLLGDAVERRRAYRTALLLIRAELSFNATLIEEGKKPAAAQYKEMVFRPGSIATNRWEWQQPALVLRFWKKSHALWAELSSTYEILQMFSATGTEPPDEVVSNLRSIENRLGTFDPMWIEGSVYFLATHRPTERLGVTLAAYLQRDKERGVG